LESNDALSPEGRELAKTIYQLKDEADKLIVKQISAIYEIGKLDAEIKKIDNKNIYEDEGGDNGKGSGLGGPGTGGSGGDNSGGRGKPNWCL
jgi:hypothetical protein